MTSQIKSFINVVLSMLFIDYGVTRLRSYVLIGFTARANSFQPLEQQKLFKCGLQNHVHFVTVFMPRNTLQFLYAASGCFIKHFSTAVNQYEHHTYSTMRLSQ